MPFATLVIFPVMNGLESHITIIFFVFFSNFVIYASNIAMSVISIGLSRLNMDFGASGTMKGHSSTESIALRFYYA